jgi:malonyl-CoA O-methyltransferase
MESFNRVAEEYLHYNRVQEEIITTLLPWVEGRVLDLGAGPVPLCRRKRLKFYLGIDSAPQMAQLNPCPILVANFDQLPLTPLIQTLKITQIVSFSALHWSKNLPQIFTQIGKSGVDYLLALFTATTFAELHNFLGISSPLPSREKIEKWGKKTLPNLQITPFNFKIEFSDGRTLLRYLKKSGVSTGATAPLSRLLQFGKKPPFLHLQLEVLVLYPSRPHRKIFPVTRNFQWEIFPSFPPNSPSPF